MKKSSPKQSLLILIAVILVLWAVVGFVVHRFLASDIGRVAEEIQEKKTDLTQLDYNARNIEYLEKDYQKLEKDGLRLENAVFASGEAIVFIERLEAIAAEYNVAQTIELPEAETKKDKKNDKKDAEESNLAGLKVLVYHLELSGSFPDLVKYIQALEDLDNYTNLNFISLSLKEEAGVIAVIEAEVYVE